MAGIFLTTANRFAPDALKVKICGNGKSVKKIVIAASVVALGLTMSGCAVVAVADAAVTVVATTVKVGATVVGTTVDVAAAGVKAVAGSSDDEEK